MKVDTTVPIKLADAIKVWQSGSPVLLVEYRNSQAETIKWRDKETRRMMEAPSLRHSVETADSAIVVNERPAETMDVNKYVAPFRKGQKVLLHVQSLTTERGIVSARGILQPIVD